MDEPGKPVASRLPFRSLPLAQREVALLIVLCLISAATFAGTHRLAAWSRGRRTEAAAQWFARGEQLLRGGASTEGVAALREAVAANRQEPRYTLALASSLADAGQRDEAQRILLQLRQSQPDDVQINYRLARLAALGGDPAEATRFYNYAMYGVARTGAEYERWRIRAELVAFLLDRGERQEAITEIGALGRELPDQLQAQLQAAHLADRAESPAQALEFYQKAMALDATSTEALAGAGEAAFALRDYAAAASHLRRAVAGGASTPQLTSHLETARLVLATDPLAAKLPAAERARRLAAGAARAASRYDACLSTSGSRQAVRDPTSVELARLRRQAASISQDPEALMRGIGVIAAAEATIRARCPGAVEPVDQVWSRIVGIHQGGRP
jgi:tetratricopeptide (TPR) repeat protein